MGSIFWAFVEVAITRLYEHGVMASFYKEESIVSCDSFGIGVGKNEAFAPLHPRGLFLVKWNNKMQITVFNCSRISLKRTLDVYSSSYH